MDIHKIESSWKITCYFPAGFYLVNIHHNSVVFGLGSILALGAVMAIAIYFYRKRFFNNVVLITSKILFLKVPDEEEEEGRS